MKVLFVSPEVNPLIRTGGLGDVVGSLPLALQKLGVDIRIICPLHRECKDIVFSRPSRSVEISLNGKKLKGELQETRLGSSQIPVYLLDIPTLFDRAGIYSDDQGDFPDNAERSFALCQSAAQIDKVTGWRPHVIHTHDWMAAATSAYLNARQINDPPSKRIRSVLTIHNLQHQGIFAPEKFSVSGLPDSQWSMEGFEYNGSLNLLKGGIQNADKITTVSPTYANEIRTLEYGCGLEASLQYRGADLIGILNGIDQDSWDPKKDKALAQPLSPHRPKIGKRRCKSALVNELIPGANPEAPLFGVVSRLYQQKGLDLLLEILPQLMAETHAIFAILGSGEPGEESVFKELSSTFPDRIGAFIGFDDGLARRIFAGSDFFIMPSRFEPCGLAQQYAMRYGALPIARKTGGLADTVRPIARGEKFANGFLFSKASGNALCQAILQALEIFANNRKFTQLRKNAMLQSCDWEQAAKQYLQVYQWSIDMP
jgi:starch synthase